MSWSARGAVSTQKRISVIEKRTTETTIPSLDALFSTYVKEGNAKLTKELVEQVYFSSFPEKDASAAFSALSMNKYNIEGLRQSGSLGVVVEMLGRLNLDTIQAPPSPSSASACSSLTFSTSIPSYSSSSFSSLSHDHITDLIRSVSILTEDDDTRHRLLHHPRALYDLLKLLKYSSGLNQEKIFYVIEKLCLSTSEGIQIFLHHDIYSTLLSPELLIRSSTLLHIRHQTALLIQKITNYDAAQFPVHRLQDVLIQESEDGLGSVICVADGYIEVQLLNSFYSYLNYINSDNNSAGVPFPNCSLLLKHLINQIKNESFVDLEHLALIVKCLMIISKDTDHCDFLLKNSLGISLQYIVRTDFELYRRSFDPTRAHSPMKLKHSRRHASSSSLPSSPGSTSASTSASSLSCGGTSSSSTRGASRSGIGNGRKGNYTVNLVRNSIHQVISTRSMEDINFKMTRLVTLIYENVLKLGIHVIGDIVSSGLISGLLFRVGKGDNIDKRFLKLVNHFIYLLLVKLTLTQDSSERSMAVSDLAPPQVYCRAGGEVCLDEEESVGSTSERGTGRGTGGRLRRDGSTKQGGMGLGQSPSAITNKLLKEKNEPVTIRTVTNKLHVQGVTELLILSLDSEEYDIIADTLISLASMHFQTIAPLLMTERVLGKITGYAHSRRDCFYSGLALTAEAITSSPKDFFPDFLHVIICEFNAISLLSKAMKLSGWVFNQKAVIYDALAVLSVHPKFREKLRKCRGINITVYEMDIRKRHRALRRQGGEYDVPEDISTDLLFAVLKKDWAATKIQAVYRAYIARKRGYTSGGLLQIFFGSIGGGK